MPKREQRADEQATDQSPRGDGDAVPGDAISELFPPDNPTARLVVSMAMASNDLDRAFLDLIRSHKEDGQDFTYRVRLSVGHLVEAIDSLGAYSQAYSDVRKLLARVPAEARKDLKLVRGTLKRAGPKVLQSVRDNTFHYPSPDPKYSPTSDEQLQAALAAMGDRSAELHVDGDTNAITFTFADDLAIRLAVGAGTDQEVFQRFEIARDGALAFSRWAKALVRKYCEVNGHSFGEPIITQKQEPTDSAAPT